MMIALSPTFFMKIKGVEIMAITSEQKEKIVELRKEGLGYKKISKIIGLKRDQVRDYCRRINEDYIPPKKKRKLKEYKCFNCGKEYVRTLEYFNHKYCSSACVKEAQFKRREDNRLRNTATCPTCGKEFHKLGGQLYCSNECKYIVKECEVCGKEFKSLRILDSKTCSRKCSSSERRKSHEEYYKEFSDIHKGWIVPITLYNGALQDLTAHCLRCGEDTTRRASVFINKRRGCSQCSPCISTGEKTVSDWLEDNNIEHIKQYKVDGLKDKALLRYDFAVLDKDNEVSILLEYDGRQHYEPVKRFGGEEEFIRQKKSDRLKEDYAKENNLKLLRISHKQKNNINEILRNVIPSLQFK